MADEEEVETKEEIVDEEAEFQKELEAEMDALDGLTPTEEVVEEEVVEEEVVGEEDKDGQEEEDGQEEDVLEEAEEEVLEEEDEVLEEEDADLNLDSDIPEVEESNELEELRKHNEMLLERVDKLTGNQQAPKKEVEAKPDTPPSVTQSTPDSVPDYIGSGDLDAILDDKDKFNSLLHSVIVTHAGAIVQQAVEQSSLALPGIVTNQLSQQTYMNNMAKTFYADHADLVVAKQTVANQFNEVMAENPDKEPMELLDIIAERSRKIVGLPLRKKSVKKVTKEGTRNPTKKKKKKPALGGNKRSSKRPTKEKISELDQDMMDLDT